jgi:hypothetical protein
MIRLTHPGHITFCQVGSDKEDVVTFTEVPESVAFARDGENLVPVVRVEALTAGDRREIKSYSAEGKLLSTTYQRRG